MDLAGLSDEELEARYRAEVTSLGIVDEVTELDVEPAESLEAWSRIEVEFPIATAVLWENPDAAWDQRRLVASVVVPLVLALGGNRSGKTYAIRELTVAMALGGDHPAVRCWLEDNDLPRDMIPNGPGEVFLVAQSAPDSIRYHRRHLDELLPANGKHWWSMNAPTEARVEIECPGYDRPAVIWFKSVDQGHRSFKGSQTRFIAISEEPEGDEGPLVLDECMRACAAVGGRVVLEMTPQNGITWTFEELVEKQKYGCLVVNLDTTHNVLLPDYASTMRWLDSLSPEQLAARRFGKHTDLQGIIYGGWTRGTGDRWGPGHLCEPFDIPKDWPRFRGGDFGLTKPTAILWGALGDDGTLYLYREYYVAGLDYDEHAVAVRELELEAGDVIEGAWGDAGDGEKAINIFMDHDVGFDPAEKGAGSVKAGISMCKARLRIQPDGRPRLKVFRPLKHFVKEIEGYRWDKKRKDEVPVKKDDHLMDAWRYMERGVAGGGY